jgi:hypothetical protein
MIKNIIDMLNSADYKGQDEDILFALGANRLPKTFKEAVTFIKRNNKWQSKDS